MGWAHATVRRPEVRRRLALLAVVGLSSAAIETAWAQKDEAEPNKGSSKIMTLEDLGRALKKNKKGEEPAKAPPAPKAASAPGRAGEKTPAKVQQETPPVAPAANEAAAPAQPAAQKITAERGCDCPPEKKPPPPAYVADLDKWVCQISTDMSVTNSGTFDQKRGKLSLYFATGEFALNQAGLMALSQQAETLQALIEKGDQLAVVGYADSNGGKSSANIVMSLKRAYNAKACVMQLIGVEERQVFVTGHGNFSAIMEPMEKTEEGNRRVDILPLSAYQRRFEETFSVLNAQP